MIVHGLIVAGGRGTRLKGPVPKQYLPLAGVPILGRTLQVFAGCAAITDLVLVVPREDIDFCRERIVAAGGLKAKVSAIVAGGTERQDSVRNGLAAIPGDDSLVAVHDAVRPLVTAPEIGACIEAARRYDAALLATRAHDTLKSARPDGIVSATLPRTGIWLAQTPQVFATALIRAAHAKAQREGFLGTDDAELVERLGHAVHIVPGSRANLKITTAEDLALAEALILGTAGRCSLA